LLEELEEEVVLVLEEMEVVVLVVIEIHIILKVQEAEVLPKVL
jgi:hypothetical protein